jgi:hypothetical protein
MEELNNLEPNLDRSSEKLHLSGVSDSISFFNGDDERIKIRNGKNCMVIEIDYGGNQLPYYTSIEKEDVVKLYEFLKKYYH